MPDINQPTLAWLRLMRVHQKVDRRTVDLLRPENLSLARFDALNQIGQVEGCTQNTLAERMLVTKGNITQLLDGMERDGLITRERVGRTREVRLTDLGRQLRERSLRLQHDHLQRIFAVLPDDDVRHLSRILTTLDRSLDEHR